MNKLSPHRYQFRARAQISHQKSSQNAQRETKQETAIKYGDGVQSRASH